MQVEVDQIKSPVPVEKNLPNIQKWGNDLIATADQLGGSGQSLWMDEAVNQEWTPERQMSFILAQNESVEFALIEAEYGYKMTEWKVKWLSRLSRMIPFFGPLRFYLKKHALTEIRARKLYTKAMIRRENYHRMYGELREKYGDVDSVRFEKAEKKGEVMLMFSKGLSIIMSDGRLTQGIYDFMKLGQVKGVNISHSQFSDELENFCLAREHGQIVRRRHSLEDERKFIRQMGDRYGS